MKIISKVVSLIAVFSISSLPAFAGGSHMLGMRSSNFSYMMSSQYGYLFLVLAAFLFAFWPWMFVDCLKRDFKKDVDKLIWVLVIVFLHIFGALLYNVMIKSSDKKQSKKK